MAKTDVTIRRAPRIWSFMMTGAVIGIIIAAHERDYVGPKQASSTGWANGAI